MRITRSLEFLAGSKEEKLPYADPDFPTWPPVPSWIISANILFPGTGTAPWNCSIWRAAR